MKFFKKIGKKSPFSIKNNDIAIIGMACRFPGANNYQAFWENLTGGVNSIKEVPINRWDWRQNYGDPQLEINKTNSKWGGFIEDIDKFDAAFFSISPKEAESMDPQQRIMLELTWSCLEDAAYSASQLRGKKVGVYIGACNPDYKELIDRKNYEPAKHYLTGVGNPLIANRISYLFDFQGPSFLIDTACSSSLIALHLAVRDLIHNDCESAIVGGVNLLIHGDRYIPFSNLGMLSPTGQCYAFDNQANGYVRGEGAGVILLKPLEKAIIDKDRVFAIIKGSSTNHGGYAKTLTSPNVYAQSQVIISACQQANIDPETISYIEAHGTGTPVGDPIEINGLKRAFTTLFKQHQKESPKDKDAFCGIGSVKTNIGHLEAASGIAGIIKVILAMKYKKLPALQNFKEINPRINLTNSPFYVVDKSIAWDIKSNTPRRAGVSSFGFGGANAHVILEEGPEYILPAQQNKPFYLVTLSAKHPDSLKQKRADLYNYLKNYPELPLEAIAYTLNACRSHFQYRCALVVLSLEDLQEKLEEVQKGKNPNEYFSGNASKEPDDKAIYKQVLQVSLEKLKHAATKETTQYKELLEALSNLYIKGYDLDWTLLHQGEEKQSISLPTYPFLKERYWISEEGCSTINRTKTNSIHIPSCIEEIKNELNQNKIPIPMINFEPINAFSHQLLLYIFQKMGIFSKSNQSYTVEQFKKELGVIPFYERLVDALVDILLRAQYIEIRGESLILAKTSFLTLEELEVEKENLVKEHPELKSYINLLWVCAEAYPDILRGKLSHMKVLFPEGSMSLMEGIYKNSPLPDYYNHLVAEAVRAYIKKRLSSNSHLPINILEIGAGTGSTSVFVFRALEEFKIPIQYLYTDISVGFLNHAEKEFKNQYPWITFKCLNIEEAPIHQGFSLNSVDIIIAANVLHATKNIERTLNNVKQLLKVNGLVILNEIARRDDFMTMTFGLIEGWWLPEDIELRIPFSPGLTRNQWEKVLMKSGFRTTLMSDKVLGIEKDLGLQVILAESEGLSIVNGTLPEAISTISLNNVNSPVQKSVEDPLRVEISNKVFTHEYLQEQMTSYVKDVISKTLKLKSSDINNQRPLQEYGVDSLTSLQITKYFSERFGQLPSTLLFDYVTIDALVDYFIQFHKDIAPAKNLQHFIETVIESV